MPATERDDDRWQQALDGIKDLSQHDIDLRRMIQSGFNVLGTEVDTLRKQVAQQQRIHMWLLAINALNLLGWLSTVALLVYTVSRLFSVG